MRRVDESLPVGFGFVLMGALSGCDAVLGMDPLFYLQDATTRECEEAGGTPVGRACFGPDMTIASYWMHTCARVQDGAVWCWGNNDWGQIGNGEHSAATVPTRVAGIGPGTDLGRAKMVAVGYGNTCALLEDSRIACWGSNVAAQVRYDPTQFLMDQMASVPVPVLQPIANATSVVVGWGFVCVDMGGNIWCWGNNLEGECAQDPATSMAVVSPTRVEFPPGFPTHASHRKLVAGKLHACLLVADAAAPLWCWGDNSRYQLGRSPEELPNSYRPIQPNYPAPLDPIVDVALGWAHTCVSTQADGIVLCWGNNDRGSLGNGADLANLGDCVKTKTCSVGPQVVVNSGRYPIKQVTALAAASGSHVCANSTGAVQCWGGNECGEVGVGDASELHHVFSAAHATVFPSSTRHIAVGENHTCILDGAPATPAAAIQCVGTNADGATGRGPFDDSAIEQLSPPLWE